jgi:hypothetical protein
MRSEHNEQIIDDAVYKVVWGDYKPKYKFLAEYCPGTMLDPEWDALEMFGLEIMTLGMRKMYGYDTPTEQD